MSRVVYQLRASCITGSGEIGLKDTTKTVTSQKNWATGLDKKPLDLPTAKQRN
jgi:hypothetical protein